MEKKKTVFFCKECGNEFPKWMGQCPVCKAWDSFTEVTVSTAAAACKSKTAQTERTAKAVPVKLSVIDRGQESRVSTDIEEFDRVLGGGIVKGSLVLVGGDPGIGKSTLLLEACAKLARKKLNLLYISGEESLRQIGMRAERLGCVDDDILFMSETSLDVIEGVINKDKPDIVVIDSIQTVYREDIASSPGSISQVRETTGSLMRLAKSMPVTVFIVGHVTKEGTVAGPKMLEHMVDTVLYFEGDASSPYRILRAVKNRFGSTNEIGVFEMEGDGLREVRNPSEHMLEGRPVGEPGSVIAASIEGTRPILAEIQALVSRTNFSMPRRTCLGIDFNRVNLMIAVIEKRMGVQLSGCDAYVNVTGGMRITEPALDLAVVTALVSSAVDKAPGDKTVIFGEVGLTGEVRGVSRAAQRVLEAQNLAYDRVIMPKVNLKDIGEHTIKVIGVGHIRELKALLFEKNAQNTEITE
ncbi:MAG: DNA repair protein RadA [Lachnospiraceae bacterium]|nr:DNA repair protein RadA [Lachnospiraceae bacterium]